jgi:hypothetical protein
MNHSAQRGFTRPMLWPMSKKVCSKDFPPFLPWRSLPPFRVRASRRVRVGNNPDAIPFVMGTNG